MNKLFIAGLMAVTALSAFADNDKLTIQRNNANIQSFPIDQIDHLNYTKSDEGFTHVNIYTRDGMSTPVRLDRMSHIAYQAGLPDNPLQISVTPHYNCATLHIVAPEAAEGEEEVYYRVSGAPQDWLSGIDRSVWAETLVADDINFIYQVANSSSFPLSQTPIKDVAEYGSRNRDWWPSETINPGTPCAIAVYTMKIVGEEVVVTSEPLLFTFDCKEWNQEGLPVTWDITAEATSTVLDVTFTPRAIEEGADTDITYLTTVIDAYTFLSYDLQSYISSLISQAEQMVYRGGLSWDEVTPSGVQHIHLTNRLTGDIYIALAFGVERGVMTTNIAFEVFEIPVAEVTDDTTFEISATQVSASEMSVNIKPSNDETKYAVYLVPATAIEGFIEDYAEVEVEDEDGNIVIKSYEELDPSQRPLVGEQWAAKKVNYALYTNTQNQVLTPYMYTGEQTVSTFNQVYGYTVLEADTDYYIMVCGYDETYARTTVMAHQLIRTDSSDLEKITFDITLSDYDDSAYYRFITVNIAPSDKDVRYVYHQMSADSPYCNLSKDDETIVKDLIGVETFNEKYGLKTTTGDFEWRPYGAQAVIPTLNPETGEYEYNYPVIRLLVFAYEGKLLSDLYVYEVDFKTGEYRYVRGPGCENPAEK